MSKTTIKRLLAEELHDFMWEFLREKAPPPSKIEQLIDEFEKRFGPIFVKEEATDDKNIPALLKSEKEIKRVRELAGIPHRGNFV